jgi:hypothetical protein
MKFLYFFLLLWVIFALLDQNPDPESGSTDLVEKGSNPGLRIRSDPEHFGLVESRSGIIFPDLDPTFGANKL